MKTCIISNGRYPRGGAVRPSMVSARFASEKAPWFHRTKNNCGTAVFHPEMSSTYEKQRQKPQSFVEGYQSFERDPFSLGWTGSFCCMFPKKFTKKHSSWPRGLPKKLTNDDFEKPNPPDQRNHNFSPPQKKYHFFERQLEGGLHLKTSNGSAIVET